MMKFLLFSAIVFLVFIGRLIFRVINRASQGKGSLTYLRILRLPLDFFLFSQWMPPHRLLIFTELAFEDVTIGHRGHGGEMHEKAFHDFVVAFDPKKKGDTNFLVRV